MRNMKPNPYAGLSPSLENILQWWAFEVKESYEYSFGRGPDDYEARYWDQWRRNNLHSKATRYALVHWLMTWLRNPSNENELRAMIKRSYQTVMRRPPRPVSDIPGVGEEDYWVGEVRSHVPQGSGDAEKLGKQEGHTFAWLCEYQQRWLDAGHLP